MEKHGQTLIKLKLSPQKDMKYAIVIADGMADHPQPELENKTPLEAARTPYADEVARSGLLGVAQTVPKGFTPGSDITTMCLLGYEPQKYYPGRAPLEAANLGIELGPEDWVFRCNLVTVRDGIMEDFSAGHVSTREASVLLGYLNDRLFDDFNLPGGATARFFAGKSYRNIMLYKSASGGLNMGASCMPPHDVVGQPIRKNLPRGKGSQVLIELMEKSHPLLKQHGINLKRLSEKKEPANMIWLWGQGQKPKMPTFKEKYGLASGAAISAVDLIKGLARLLGWEVIEVPGATGYIDTDYAAKGRYAVEALKGHDLVLVHVEAPDEASHMGNVKEKIKAIENIDASIVGPMLQALKSKGEYRLLFLCDHYTVTQIRTHSAEPVPFAMCGSGLGPASGLAITEANALKTKLHLKKGHELMGLFLVQT